MRYVAERVIDCMRIVLLQVITLSFVVHSTPFTIVVVTLESTTWAFSAS